MQPEGNKHGKAIFTGAPGASQKMPVVKQSHHKCRFVMLLRRWAGLGGLSLCLFFFFNGSKKNLSSVISALLVPVPSLHMKVASSPCNLRPGKPTSWPHNVVGQIWTLCFSFGQKQNWSTRKLYLSWYVQPNRWLVVGRGQEADRDVPAEVRLLREMEELALAVQEEAVQRLVVDACRQQGIVSLSRRLWRKPLGWKAMHS